MHLLKRLKVQREVREMYSRFRRERPNASHEDIEDMVSDGMKDMYGTDISWPDVLELVLKILALLAPLILKEGN